MQTDNLEIDCNDPQFVEVLEACLRKKIAACKEIVTKNKAEVKQMKLEVRRELCRRKELKKKVDETKEAISVLTDVAKKLDEQIKEIYDDIALLEANEDDQYKLDQYRIKEYEALLDKCITTWESYHAQYEQLPLAKVRLELRHQIKKASIEQKLLTYKLMEQKKIIKMRNEIDWLQTRAAIVNFVNALVENSKANKSLTEIRTCIGEYTKEFNSLKLQLDEQREYEEEEKRKRVKSLLEMPPPKIDLSHMRPSNSLESEQKSIPEVTWDEAYDGCHDVSDTISVNTVILEQLCTIEDESMDQTNLIDETIQKNCKNSAEDGSVAQTHTLNKTKENDIRDIDNKDSSLEMTRMNKKFQQQPLAFSSINDRVDLEIVQDQCNKEIPQQQNFCDKEAIMMDIVQSEEEVKLQTENSKYDSKDNKQIQSGPSVSAPVNIIENAIVKNPSVQPFARPIITKIEKVNCNVIPMTKKSPGNVTTSSMFLPHHYDYCKSDIVDNDLTTLREMQSMEGSLGNCNISGCSNVWNIDDVDDAITECGSIREEKAESAQDTPRFDFTNILKNNTSKFDMFF